MTTTPTRSVTQQTARRRGESPDTPPRVVAICRRHPAPADALPDWPALPGFGPVANDPSTGDAAWFLVTPRGACAAPAETSTGSGPSPERVHADDLPGALNRIAGADTPLWIFVDTAPEPGSIDFAAIESTLGDGPARLATPRRDGGGYDETVELDGEMNIVAVHRTYGDSDADTHRAQTVGLVCRRGEMDDSAWRSVASGDIDSIAAERQIELPAEAAAPLPTNLGDYLAALHRGAARWPVGLPEDHDEIRPGVWAHASAEVDPKAMIVGPAVIGPRARVGRCSLLGPLAIGADVTVEDLATVSESVLHDHAHVADHAFVYQSVVARAEAVETGANLDFAIYINKAARPGGGTPPEVRHSVGRDPAESVFERARRTAYDIAKRGVDIVGALVALALTLPFYPLIALAIKLDSPGPVFFKHKRQGRGGRTFDCLKFRSMRTDAEEIKARLAQANQCDGPQFHMDDDPRLTRLGRWMRSKNIDELPQFINVLLGHMSLVGPRPSPDKENQLCPAWRRARLSVRPGITGLWQVCRRDRAGGDFHQWIYYDTEYVQHRTLWLDLRILWATARLEIMNWTEVGPDSVSPSSKYPVHLPYGMRSVRPLAAWAAVLLVGWVVAWWTTFAEMWRVWQTNDDYSHGPLVPVIAGYMIYRRRRNLKGLRIHPTWAGIVLLGLAFAMRFVGLYGWYGSLDRLSMIAGLAGVLLMVFGMDLLRRIVWPLAFLCLMFPLPNRVDQAVMPPMQMQAAAMGQWMTEMAGMEVSRLGNVLIVEGHPLEVARACNGLRLVFAFVALACCVAYLSKRPAWEKILIAASSLPIAVALNGFRVFAIGAVLSASDWQWSVSDVHDAWAWAMMPMALGLLLLEIGILNNLFIEQEERWQFNA